MRPLAVAVIAVTVIISVRSAHAQISAGSNRVISPEVVAYWQSHDNGDGTASLDLLVLWRGSPGWFMRGTGSSGGSGGRGGFGRWDGYHTMSYGDITLTIELSAQSKEFDPATTVARILGQEIPLRDTNVVLIDGADSGAPTIVGVRRIEPRFAGSDPVAAIVKRSAELFDFLRCDATLPDSRMQLMISLICAQMRP